MVKGLAEYSVGDNVGKVLGMGVGVSFGDCIGISAGKREVDVIVALGRYVLARTVGLLVGKVESTKNVCWLDSSCDVPLIHLSEN